MTTLYDVAREAKVSIKTVSREMCIRDSFKTPQLLKVPYIVLDRTMEVEEAPTIKLDNYSAGVLAASHLLELGHQKFACISGPLKIKICRERPVSYTHLPLKIKVDSF